MPEQATRRLMAGAVLVVAAIAAVVSYIHIQTLALTHGQGHLAAMLLPISVDGMISAASLALLYAARAGIPSPWLGRLMLGLGVAATVAANAVEGASGGVVGVMVSAWPAIAFIGGIELLVWTARTARLSAPEDAPQAARVSASEAAKPAAAPTATRVQPEVRRRTARQGAARKTVTPAAAEKRYAAELASGALPSMRSIQRDLKVGQRKAQLLRAHLETALAA
jgi:Protein of unknown function (DUF2637)